MKLTEIFLVKNKVRDILIHNDLFYLLIYTELHWEINIYDKNLDYIIKSINTDVSSDFEITNFLVGNNDQIIIEFDNFIKILNRSKDLSIICKGKITNIIYQDNYYYILSRHVNIFHIHTYNEDWVYIGETIIPEIKQRYGSAKLFIDSDIYLAIYYPASFFPSPTDPEPKSILYHFDRNLNLLNTLTFDENFECHYSPNFFYLCNPKTGEINIIDAKTLTFTCVQHVEISDMNIKKFYIHGIYLYLIKGRLDPVQIEQYSLI